MVERVLAWGSLGAVCGAVLSFGNGVTYISPGIPGDPWMEEFYAVHVMQLMSFEGVVGGLIGAGIGLSIPTASVRRKTFTFAACGAALGAASVGS